MRNRPFLLFLLRGRAGCTATAIVGAAIFRSVARSRAACVIAGPFGLRHTPIGVSIEPLPIHRLAVGALVPQRLLFGHVSLLAMLLPIVGRGIAFGSAVGCAFLLRGVGGESHRGSQRQRGSDGFIIIKISFGLKSNSACQRRPLSCYMMLPRPRSWDLNPWGRAIAMPRLKRSLKSAYFRGDRMREQKPRGFFLVRPTVKLTMPGKRCGVRLFSLSPSGDRSIRIQESGSSKAAG
jgi:hypothetical protein